MINFDQLHTNDTVCIIRGIRNSGWMQPYNHLMVLECRPARCLNKQSSRLKNREKFPLWNIAETAASCKPSQQNEILSLSAISRLLFVPPYVGLDHWLLSMCCFLKILHFCIVAKLRIKIKTGVLQLAPSLRQAVTGSAVNCDGMK